MKSKSSVEYIDITNILSLVEFEQIKNFILLYGDKSTYRNYDNDNPHYFFEEFHAYLGADIGQRNINNDPSISDFNQLVIRLPYGSDIQYYHIVIVRKNDIGKKAWVKHGMKEQEVYLVDVYSKGIMLMKKNIIQYIEKMKKQITK